MLIFDRRREHDDLACAPRRQRKASRRRADVRRGSKLEAKPPDFDAQPRAMRFIGVLRPEGAGEERAPRDVRGPRFAQRARKREQYRTRRERYHGVGVAHDMAACIHDERSRRQQRFNLLKPEQPLLARRNQARGRRVQDAGGAFDLRQQRRDARMARGTLGLDKRIARRFRAQAPDRHARDRQFVGGPQRRRQRRGIELRQRALGLVELPDQQQTPNLKMLRMRGVRPVAVPLERRPRRVERFGGPAQVARDECDLGLGNDAPRAGHRLFRAEGARRLSQQSLGPNELAELSHRDAAKRQRRRIVAQRDPLERAERIARCQCMRGGCDQRVIGSRHTCNSHPRSRLIHELDQQVWSRKDTDMIYWSFRPATSTGPGRMG